MEEHLLSTQSDMRFSRDRLDRKILLHPSNRQFRWHLPTSDGHWSSRPTMTTGFMPYGIGNIAQTQGIPPLRKWRSFGRGNRDCQSSIEQSEGSGQSTLVGLAWIRMLSRRDRSRLGGICDQQSGRVGGTKWPSVTRNVGSRFTIHWCSGGRSARCSGRARCCSWGRASLTQTF